MLSRRVNGALRVVSSPTMSRCGGRVGISEVMFFRRVNGAFRGVLSRPAINSRNLSSPPATDTVKTFRPLPALWTPHKLPAREQELHQSLVQCQTKVVSVAEFIAKYAPPNQEAAAALDVHEARCMERMLCECESAEMDETLFMVVALCYIARLSSAEMSACAATMKWEGGAAQLDCLVDFARQELLSTAGIQRLMSLDGAKQDEEVSDHFERLWAKFCQERSIQVSSETAARNAIDMDFSPPPPYRPPSSWEFRWRDKVTRTLETPNTQLLSCDRHRLAGDRVPPVPKLYGLVTKIVKANFFLTLPVDRLGWNMLSTPPGQDGIRWAYTQLLQHPIGQPFSYRLPGEIDSMPLLIKDLVLLLEGITNNKLLRSLVTQRPPLSVLPHRHALQTCMKHARLWLGRYDLRIYYDHHLTYGQLATHSVGAEEEEEVLRDGFSKERTPSLVEELLRGQTLCSMWETNCELIHMRPEDYDAAKAPDTPMWRAYKKYVGHPMEVPADRNPVLIDIDNAYTRCLVCETKSRSSEFPPLAEDFSHEELERDKLHSWM